MLKSYIKIALKGMLRQKFFTSVSLFGISFTIMIFSISVGMTRIIGGDIAPGINRSKTLYFEGFSIQKNGKQLPSPSGVDFLNKAKKLSSVEKLSMYTMGKVSSLTNSKKLTFNTAFVDEQIWSIYNYTFVEGNPFAPKDVVGGQSIAIITESVKKLYFGNEKALGKYIPTTPQLKVVGVIKDFVSINGPATESASILIPLMRYHAKSEFANYNAIILVHKRADIPKVKNEILGLIKKDYNPLEGDIKFDLPDFYEKLDFTQYLSFLGAFVFFIMVIPTLNLIGLNVNRITERSSEIGVRKAFGASPAVLAGQFITENIIITLLGGILGIILTVLISSFVIKVLYTNQDIIPSGNFLINYTTIIYALGASLFFGLLSGALPAWRMSKLHTVKALKGGNL